MNESDAFIRVFKFIPYKNVHENKSLKVNFEVTFKMGKRYKTSPGRCSNFSDVLKQVF